jgi:hypothetical protein
MDRKKRSNKRGVFKVRIEMALFKRGDYWRGTFPSNREQGDYFSVDSLFPEIGLIRKKLRSSQVMAQVETHLHYEAAYRKSPPRKQSCVSKRLADF